MKSTRDRILQTLLRSPRSSINTLAEAVGINPISVRHHLTNLQAEGLVEAEEERHGVGRPRLLYNLTQEGLELFPTRYLRLTMRLLEQLKGSLPSSMVQSLFSQMAQDVIAGYQGELEGLSMDETVAYIKHRLTSAGGPDDLFLPDALKAIFASSGGIPREINNLCSAALLKAFAIGAKKVDAKLVKLVLDMREVN